MISVLEGADQVDVFHPMRNAAESAKLFALDGQEMLDLERFVETADRRLIGVMHSHTETSAYPSPTDIRDSARFDPMGTFFHVIVSLRQAEPVVRCYTIAGDDITEVPVVLADDTYDTQDEGGAVAMAAVVPLPSSD